MNSYILFIFFIIFIISSFVQLVYYWAIFSRFAFYKGNEKTQIKQAVSVVICAKNEYYNLQANLPFILEQDYPDFEVIVVNDSSDDDTVYLLEDFSRKFTKLKIINIT
ncbi:MAG: glycosyltransferase, partial [Bacteroidales bacterium]|nr:glycosyltransferase [Bacteroidales bacterium]